MVSVESCDVMSREGTLMKKHFANRQYKLALMFLCLLTVPGAYAVDLEPDHPMSKLSWLLGQWTFEDVQVNGEYWERGTRDCVQVLHNQYIRCESLGVSNSGSERSYYFILGYNRIDERYEMVGLTSSYPRQNLYIIEPSEDGFTLEIINNFWTNDGIAPLNGATIQYNGVDEYVWNIRNGDIDPETGKNVVGFIDTVRRVK